MITREMTVLAKKRKRSVASIVVTAILLAVILTVFFLPPLSINNIMVVVLNLLLDASFIGMAIVSLVKRRGPFLFIVTLVYFAATIARFLHLDFLDQVVFYATYVLIGLDVIFFILLVTNAGYDRKIKKETETARSHIRDYDDVYKKWKKDYHEAIQNEDANRLNELANEEYAMSLLPKEVYENAKKYNDIAESVFTGGTISYFFHNLWWSFLTIITLGIATPWVICKKERWYANRTKINGHQLRFEGSGGSLIGHYLLWLLLTIITLGIYGIFLAKKMKDWKAKHYTFEGADESLQGKYNGSIILGALINIGCTLLSIITLGIMYPQCLCWSKRYELAHTYYRGRRLHFNGNGLQLIGRNLLWLLFIVLTLGIYALFVPIRLHRWEISHTHFEGAPRK